MSDAPDKPPLKGRPKPGELLRSTSLAVEIPALLGAGPLVGAALGYGVGRLFGHSQPGLMVGLLIGFAAGVRETIRLIRRLQAEEAAQSRSRDQKPPPPS